MKVLFITHYSGLYGANKSLLQLILELNSFFEVESHVIVPELGVFTDELMKNKIPFKVFKFYNWLNNNSFLKAKAKLFLNHFLFLKVYHSLKKQEENYNIIHTNSSVTNLGGYLAKRLKTHHIWHIREYGYEDYNLKYYIGLKKAGKYFNSNSSLIIAISKDLKNYYSKYINPNKIKVIYNGVKKNPSFSKDFNTNDTINICFLGVISENKNQLEAIRAVNYIKKVKNISNFVLNIVGDGTEEYIELLKRYIEKEGLKSNVKFNGYVTDVDGFLQTMDLGVVSSKREAFGRVTIEFMLNKIPVIACNTGANKEIIKYADLGSLYEHGNYVELAEILCDFIHHRERIRITGERAYDYAIANFSSAINTENVFKAYKNAVNLKRK